MLTSIYRKPTFSGVFTHYNSFIDDSYKKSLIFTLLFRCYSLCSNYEKFHVEIEFLRDIFKRNSYPSNLVENAISIFLKQLYVPKKVVLTVPKKELLLILPFMGNLSISLRKQIHSCFGQILPPCKIKLIFKSTNRLSTIFSFKDTIPKALCSNLVYKFMCGDCNVSYYGKTERHLKVRACEHLGITPMTGKRVVNPRPSAVNDHLLNSNHQCDFTNFSIIANDNNSFRLLLKESILIAKDNPYLNKQIASMPLSLF